MFYEKIEFNIGFICSTYDSRLSTNHSLRLKNLNRKNVIKVVEKNLIDLIKLLKLSENLGCGIFRLGSQFIPFASHYKFKKTWLKDVQLIIRDFLPEIKKFNIRITMHPGQYVVLSTYKKTILKRSLEEIWYHFWVLDQFELDYNSTVVIHAGGAYGNKKEAMNNLINVFKKNKWLKTRLSLENDEKIYNAQDILKICEILDIPFTFDYFHHRLNFSQIKIDDILKTWWGRRPEFHISSNRNKKNNHSDYVKIKDFINFLDFIKTASQKKINVDILLEAKKKELAVIKLLKSLKNEKCVLV